MNGPRACLEVELPALIAAANRVFRPHGGDMARDYPLLFPLENLRNLRVITDRDGVIAHAGLCVRPVSWGGAVAMAEVAALGAVFTEASHRGQGLGAAVVADALACARARNAALALVSGDGPLYQRQGFVTMPPAACWTWPAPGGSGAAAAGSSDGGTTGGSDGGLRARPFGAADLGRDLALAAGWYDAEPVHFVRDRADWQALWAAQVVFAWPAHWWMVERGGNPVGYLVVAQRARRRVLELAGDRDALLAAAPLVADELLAPALDGATARAASALGWTRSELALALGSQWLTGQRPFGPDDPPVLPWYGLNYV